MELFEVRHVTGVKSNFGIIDRRECLLHSISREDQPLSHAIISNSKPLVEAQQYLFETLWAKAIPAQYKIKEIEEGIKPDFIETIREPAEIQQHIFQLIKSAKEELLLLFSTPNAFYRQMQMRIIQILDEAASNHGVNVRILIHSNDRIMETLENLKRNKEITVLELQTFLQMKLWTIIKDQKFSLEIEVKDDTKSDISEAIGLATYSNSESTVWTQSSIFETLWTQSELHQE
jgi:two-component system, OmpR family, sensor histidine kinase VicK